MSKQPNDDTGRRCPRCDCADRLPQCQHCKVCPHARRPGDAVTAQQPVRPPTPDEHFRELYRRTAELGDRVAALINPAWGIKTGILPEDHPFYPGMGEQGAPVDWHAIAKQRERELKKVGGARHRAEQALARVRELHREEYGSCEHCTRADSVPYPCPTIRALDGDTISKEQA